MRFLRALTAIAFALCIALPAHAQTTTTITATQLLNGGTGLASGKLCLTGVSPTTKQPITFTTSGGGLNLQGRAFCQTLTGGALTGALTVPNAALTLPANICWQANVWDSTAGVGIDLGVTCFSGSTFSFDTALLGTAPSAYPPAVVAFAQSTPGSSGAACTAGTLWSDATYVYVCTATNTIKRVALSSF